MNKQRMTGCPGLQAERTDLSWARTALAFLVNGGLLLFRHPLSDPGVLQWAGGAIAFALALFTLAMSKRRRRVLLRKPLPRNLTDPTLLLLLGAATSLFGLLTLGVLLAP